MQSTTNLMTLLDVLAPTSSAAVPDVGAAVVLVGLYTKLIVKAW